MYYHAIHALEFVLFHHISYLEWSLGIYGRTALIIAGVLNVLVFELSMEWICIPPFVLAVSSIWKWGPWALHCR
jgi:hypothetical protein